MFLVTHSSWPHIEDLIDAKVRLLPLRDTDVECAITTENSMSLDG